VRLRARACASSSPSSTGTRARRACVDRANAIQTRRANPNPTVTRARIVRARASRGALARVEICVRKRFVRSVIAVRTRRRRRRGFVRGVDASRTRVGARHRAGTRMRRSRARSTSIFRIDDVRDRSMWNIDRAMRNIDVDRWWISPGRDESMTGDIWEGYIQRIERCMYPHHGIRGHVIDRRRARTARERDAA
jgi:hypothetical protein